MNTMLITAELVIVGSGVRRKVRPPSAFPTPCPAPLV